MKAKRWKAQRWNVRCRRWWWNSNVGENWFSLVLLLAEGASWNKSNFEIYIAKLINLAVTIKSTEITKINDINGFKCYLIIILINVKKCSTWRLNWILILIFDIIMTTMPILNWKSKQLGRRRLHNLTIKCRHRVERQWAITLQIWTSSTILGLCDKVFNLWSLFKY